MNTVTSTLDDLSTGDTELLSLGSPSLQPFYQRKKKGAELCFFAVLSQSVVDQHDAAVTAAAAAADDDDDDDDDGNCFLRAQKAVTRVSGGIVESRHFASCWDGRECACQWLTSLASP